MDERDIARLFPVEVAVCIADRAMYRTDPHPDEAAAVAGAVAKRRQEFAAGRACARRALAMLGSPPIPLPSTARRAPAWPDGYVGSITHCAGFCAAVAAGSDTVRSLGLDAEAAAPLDSELVAMVCAPAERSAFAHLPPPAASDWPKLAFCAKEAFYKCVDPVWRNFLDFLDVRVAFRIDPSRDQGTFSMTGPGPAAPVIGRWAVDGERAYAGATWPLG